MSERVPPARKLLLFITEDQYFWSHRLPLARAALRRGYQVGLATRVHEHGPRIRAEGIELFPLRHLERTGMDPRADARLVVELAALVRRFEPTIMHNVALKPILWGTATARALRVPGIVNAIAGMGSVFLASGARASLRRGLITSALRTALFRSKAVVIVQNEDDRALLIEHRLVRRERTVLVPGSGVDTSLYSPGAEPDGDPVVVYGGRLIFDKGLRELAEAGRILRERGVRCRIAFVGKRDPANPSSIPESTLEQWAAAGWVELWGPTEDMPAQLGRCHIACLPSYREGLPKFMLDAAAAGKPLVASDVPGCREIVRPGVTGHLVPARDAAALADAIERLVNDPAERHRLGAEARRVAEREFALERVVEGTLAVYDRVLHHG